MNELGKYCPKEWRAANDLIIQIVSLTFLFALGSYRWSPMSSVVGSMTITLILTLTLTLTPTLALITLRLSCAVVVITVLQSSYTLYLSVTIPNSYPFTMYSYLLDTGIFTRSSWCNLSCSITSICALDAD